MSELFTIRVGDRKPYLAYKFPFPLTDALGVTFSARDPATDAVFVDDQPAVIANGTYLVNDQMVTYTPADGVAFYPWTALDTSMKRDVFLFLFHVNWPGNLPETVPSDGYGKGRIGDNF
ncbi:hypothetical protein [Tabrizicola sp.]|uniref:hypothetical protein n=1 Tax=Tabrizicola sp. TaxID=2005166 RepID=UPI0025F1BAEA|nr:hypothetical protein [Tabrizicola sp.]